jgi:hypothetical protein
VSRCGKGSVEISFRSFACESIMRVACGGQRRYTHKSADILYRKSGGTAEFYTLRPYRDEVFFNEINYCLHLLFASKRSKNPKGGFRISPFGNPLKRPRKNLSPLELTVSSSAAICFVRDGVLDVPLTKLNNNLSYFTIFNLAVKDKY